MEKLRTKFTHFFMLISLLLNLVFIGGGVVFFKTNWLDLPALALIIGKNCDQGLSNLIQLPNPQVAAQLTTKFCQARSIKVPANPVPPSPL